MNLTWNHQSAHGPRTEPAIIADCYQSAEFHTESIALGHLNAAMHGHAQFNTCQIEHVWYIHGKWLQVVYRLSRSTEAQELVTVRFCRRSENEAMFEAMQARARNANAVLHLQDWNAVGFIFPEDPQLPELNEFLDTSHILDRFKQDRQAVSVQRPLRWELLHYLPGKRCVFRSHPDNNMAPVIGKLRRGAPESHRVIQSLWDVHGYRFAMPRPLGCDARLNARWESYVEGQLLEEVMHGISPGLLLSTIMRSLVELHRTPLSIASSLPVMRTQELLGRYRDQALNRIQPSLPALSPACEQLYHHLAARAVQFQSGSLSTLHGDFHTANIMLQDGRAVFIDCDNLRLGPPAYDVAHLGCRFLLSGLINGTLRPETADAVASLPHLYEEAGGAKIPESEFAWQMAAQLVAYEIRTCVRHLSPDLSTRAALLLELAQTILDAGRFEAGLIRRCGWYEYIMVSNQHVVPRDKGLLN